jgi:hypothetical protein
MFSNKQNNYTNSPDKIYTKYGKIISIIDELNSYDCLSSSSYEKLIFRFTVIGPMASGKTSVIDSLLGYNFLPSGFPSKRNLIINVEHTNENISTSVNIENKNFTNLEEARKFIKELQKNTDEINKEIPIQIRLVSNQSADMIFYDTSEINLDNINNINNNLMVRTLSDSSNFIILVIDCQHFSKENYHIRDLWFNLIRKYDKNLERTICLITKPDNVDNHFNFDDVKYFLQNQNEILNLKYSFVCVKSNLPLNKDASELARIEREYFGNHKTFQYLNLSDNFTFEVVGEKITKFIYESYKFKKNIQSIYKALKEKIEKNELEISSIGNELIDFSSESKDLYLQSLVNIFSETVEKAFNGKAEREQDNVANRDLKRIYSDFLDSYISYHPSTEIDNKFIIETIQKTEESYLSGFPSSNVILSLLDSKIFELKNEVQAYFDNTIICVSNLIKTIITRLFSRFPKVLSDFDEIIMGYVTKQFEKTKAIQENIAEMNFNFIYIDELVSNYQELIQTQLINNPNYNNLNNTNTNNQNNNQNNQNYPFKQNKDISFFKSAKNKESYYRSLADYVKALVDYIYSLIIRNLRESIPKATGHFFIKSLKSGLRFFLLQYINKNPQLAQNLEEDPEMANKRKYLVESTKKMKKIEKNISYDDKLVKIIKEEKKSNLDKILEEQGIKKTNSFKQEIEGNKTNNNRNVNTLFGDKNKTSNFKTPTQTNPNTNLFGKDKNEAKTKSNLFGNPMVGNNNNTNNNTTNNSKSNLFGNTNSNNQQTQSQKNILNNQQQKTNLFGNPSQQSKTSNLFGNPNPNNQQKSQSSKTNNLFGPSNTNKPNTNQQNNNLNKNNNNTNNNNQVNVSLKFDPKSNQIKDVNIQANMDYDTAKKLYEQNKQYLPSTQQMLSGAKTAYKYGNKYAEEEKKKGNDPLSNLFGNKK